MRRKLILTLALEDEITAGTAGPVLEPVAVVDVVAVSVVAVVVVVTSAPAVPLITLTPTTRARGGCVVTCTGRVLRAKLRPCGTTRS